MSDFDTNTEKSLTQLSHIIRHVLHIKLLEIIYDVKGTLF